MTEKRKINVIIDGRNFTVVGGENEEYIRNLASYVNEKIKDLASKNERLCQTMSATLAALNIADELYKTSAKLHELENNLKDPIEKYSSVNGELNEAKVKIMELEKVCSDYKENELKIRANNEDLIKQINKYEQSMELKEKELIDSQNMIKRLQDKIFNNQLELIEIKKECRN